MNKLLNYSPNMENRDTSHFYGRGMEVTEEYFVLFFLY